MKEHILDRLLESHEAEFTMRQRNQLLFVNNRIYPHKVLRINYTTYDLPRAQDLVNPRTHSDIMVLSHEDAENPHPYWYARVIGIFHAYIQYCEPELQDGVTPQRIDFLWVRWFARNKNLKSGWAVRRLPCVGFYPSDESDAFGFVHPDDVVRSVHLIPGFRYGRTSALLPPSIARNEAEKDEDWD